MEWIFLPSRVVAVKSIALSIIGLLLLSGCSVSNQIAGVRETCFHTVTVTEGKLIPQYCSDESAIRTYHSGGLTVEIPGHLFKFLNRDSVVFDSNPSNDPSSESDYTITIQEVVFAPPCSEKFTGASSLESLLNTNGKTIWGRVDAYDSYQPSFPLEQMPFCRPPVLQWDANWETGIDRISNDAAYVLCSENGDKRVLICVSQVTDNPQLAEEIFRTFRWK
jgi:hypothetical protein